MPPMAAAIGSAARARVTQVACDELALEFQPDDEEEDRQQPVGRPRRNAQVQMQRLRPDRELRHRAVGVRPRRVRPHQCRTGGGQQQHAADGLLAEDLGEPLRLRPRAARQQSELGIAESLVMQRGYVRCYLPDRDRRQIAVFGCQGSTFTASLQVERREVWSAVAPQVRLGRRPWEYRMALHAKWRHSGRQGTVRIHGHVDRATYRCSVRAEQIAEEFPVVAVDSNALDAVRLMADRRLPGLVVTDQPVCR